MSAKVLFQIILGSTIVLSSITSSVKAVMADGIVEFKASQIIVAKEAADRAMAAIAASAAEIAEVEAMVKEDMELARDAAPADRTIIENEIFRREQIIESAREFARESMAAASRILLFSESLAAASPAKIWLEACTAIRSADQTLAMVNLVKEELRRTHAAEEGDASPEVVITVLDEDSDLHGALAESVTTAELEADRRWEMARASRPSAASASAVRKHPVTSIDKRCTIS